MRRLAFATLAAGVVITALSLTTSQADASVGFWRSAGLSGVDAFGVYNVGSVKARLNVDLKDVAKDDASAALRFIFTEKGRKRAVHVVALPGDSIQDKWFTVASKNTGHLYVQECVGGWRGKSFRVRKCADPRRYY